MVVNRCGVLEVLVTTGLDQFRSPATSPEEVSWALRSTYANCLDINPRYQGISFTLFSQTEGNLQGYATGSSLGDRNQLANHRRVTFLGFLASNLIS